MEAIDVIVKHVRECGMLMPMDWVVKNGDDSPFMDAIMLAIKALKNGIDINE
jgi:hypothetical protein